MALNLAQDHQAYLRDNLPLLFREGWQGYQRHGRGAVILDDRAGDLAQSCSERELKRTYYSNQQAVSSNNGWPNKEIRKLVRDYNPRKQIVCVFLLPDNYCAGYRLWSAELTPEQAAMVNDER